MVNNVALARHSFSGSNGTMELKMVNKTLIMGSAFYPSQGQSQFSVQTCWAQWEVSSIIWTVKGIWPSDEILRVKSQNGTQTITRCNFWYPQMLRDSNDTQTITLLAQVVPRLCFPLKLRVNWSIQLKTKTKLFSLSFSSHQHHPPPATKPCHRLHQ